MMGMMDGGMMQEGDGMLHGLWSVVAMALMMGFSVLLSLAVLALVLLAIVWLFRDLRSRPERPGGDTPASMRS